MKREEHSRRDLDAMLQQHCQIQE
uniref:Uncharacterized protein n=1 Tax=Arundo donax TaxID=35708 RepID=A0A0A8Y6B0_ARUDO